MNNMIKNSNLSNSNNFYVTAGEKCKTIGRLDGTFPDFGHHLENEMGGVWTHPIKIADAFWLKVNNEFLQADEYETFPYGNRFQTTLSDEIKVNRFQMSPDEISGVVIEYEFTNNSNCDLTYECEFIIRFDILPVWFSEQCGIYDFHDEAIFHEKNNCIIAKDTGHDWYAILGSDHNMSEENVFITKNHLGPTKTAGKGISAKIYHKILLKAQRTYKLLYFLTGSDSSKENAISQMAYTKLHLDMLKEKKQKRYQNIYNTSHLITSDPDFDKVFEWVKYNNDWLIIDSGKYGRGLSAGIPEYPWWFGCDNAYSIQGLLAIGSFELAKQTLLLLHDYSVKHNGNGRIVHEITTNGQIAHSGNTQETSHYITAVYHYLKWTGDLDTVKKVFPYCVKGIDWLFFTMDPDGDLLPSGYGIIEIKGLNVELIDTSVYTCQALFCMDEMAKLIGSDGTTFLTKAIELKNLINNYLWNDKEKLFVDAVSTPAQILERANYLLTNKENSEHIDPAYHTYLLNLEKELKELPQHEEIPFIIHKNWVICTPMETSLADYGKGIEALKTMSSDTFVGPYGVYLAGFLQEHTMTIFTGVLAVALCRYQKTNEALDLIERMFQTFSLTLPGSINEMSPDYGCFVQAWTLYATMVPVLEGFAGFMPSMHKDKLLIRPCIPAKWTKMELTNVKVSKGVVDFYYKKKENKETYHIHYQHINEVEMQFEQDITSIFLNGNKITEKILLTPGDNLIEIVK